MNDDTRTETHGAAAPARTTAGGPAAGDDLAARVRTQVGRIEQGRREGQPTLMRQLAAVGVLGWLVVVPLLGGVALGRWLDHRLGTGIMLTSALLLVGLVIGCWSGWRWMRDHR